MTTFLQVARLLLDNGADMELGDRFGRFRLLYSCLNDELDMVRLLVDRGADVNRVVSLDGCSPL